MADVKISALPAAVSVAGADLIPIVQGGVSKQATVSLLPAGSGIATTGNTTVTNPTLVPSAVGAVGMTINGPAGYAANMVEYQRNGTTVAFFSTYGALRVGIGSPTAGITFGNSGSSILLDGTNAQTISMLGSAAASPAVYINAIVGQTADILDCQVNGATKFAVSAAGGIGAYGHAVPAQPATPVTLADVIAIIRGCGLAA